MDGARPRAVGYLASPGSLLRGCWEGRASPPGSSIDIKFQPPGVLEWREAWSYRANGVVAVALKLTFPAGAPLWEEASAELATPSHPPLRVLSVWLEPVPGEELPTLRVVLEAEATAVKLGGPFTLKLWNAQGPGTFTLTGVTFP